MTEPVFAICEQQRCRSACASAQSEISNLCLVYVAAQAGFCLTWSGTLKTGFHVTMLILMLVNISSFNIFYSAALDFQEVFYLFLCWLRV